MNEPVHIKINAPDKTTPGHLQRQKRVVALQRRQKSLAREQRKAQFELKARSQQTQAIDEATQDADDAREERLYGDLDLLLDEIVSFIAGYVVEPTDPTAVREAIMQASESELETLMSAVSGGEVPLEATPSDASSAIG